MGWSHAGPHPYRPFKGAAGTAEVGGFKWRAASWDRGTVIGDRKGGTCEWGVGGLRGWGSTGGHCVDQNSLRQTRIPEVSGS